jgi:hypothetical protein
VTTTAVPALPAAGPVGFAAPIVTAGTGGHAGREILVLTDGRQYVVLDGPECRGADKKFALRVPSPRDGRCWVYRSSEMGSAVMVRIGFLPGDR